MKDTHYLVRYGSLGSLARCASDAAGALCRDDRVIVQTERGLELGTILNSVAHGATADGDGTGLLRIVRPADSADLDLAQELERTAATLFERCHDFLARRRSELQLVDIEQLIDRENVILHVLNSNGGDVARELVAALRIMLGKTVSFTPAQKDHPGYLARFEAGGGGCGTGSCGCHDE